MSKNQSAEMKAGPIFKQRRIILPLTPLGLCSLDTPSLSGVMFYWLVSQHWISNAAVPGDSQHADFHGEAERYAASGAESPHMAKKTSGDAGSSSRGPASTAPDDAETWRCSRLSKAPAREDRKQRVATRPVASAPEEGTYVRGLSPAHRRPARRSGTDSFSGGGCSETVTTDGVILAKGTAMRRGVQTPARSVTRWRVRGGEITADYGEGTLDITDLDGDIDIDARDGPRLSGGTPARTAAFRLLSKPDTVSTFPDSTDCGAGRNRRLHKGFLHSRH
jgi:hypothetical protein